MPWQRTGDNAAHYPPLVAVLSTPGADDRMVNEVAGWVWRCSVLSAAHMTDLLVDDGTARLAAGTEGRYRALTRAAVRTGLLRKVKRDGGLVAWQIVEDDEFIHVRSREEVERDRRRDRDRHDQDLVNSVLQRDGDQCRYCGRTVNPRDRRGGRGRQFDHRNPVVDEPTTVDTYVVACRVCNRRRTDTPTAEADATMPLRPPPLRPYFHPDTITRLSEWLGEPVVSAPVPGETSPAGTAPPAGPGTQPGGQLRTATQAESAHQYDPRPGIQPGAPEQSRPASAGDARPDRTTGQSRSAAADDARPDDQLRTATQAERARDGRQRGPASGDARLEVAARPSPGDERHNDARAGPDPPGSGVDPRFTPSSRGGTRVGSGRAGTGGVGSVPPAQVPDGHLGSGHPPPPPSAPAGEPAPGQPRRRRGKRRRGSRDGQG